MTTMTRNLTLALAGGIILGAAAVTVYKFKAASTPVEGSATTTSQTATTTAVDQSAVAQEVLNSLDLRAMIDRAYALKKAGNYDGAIAELTKATQVYPNDTVSYNNLADIYLNFKKDYAKAEANYKKVIANNATYLDAYRNLFLLYTTTSYKPSNTAAEDIITAALKAVPNAYDLQVLLARYYRDTGRTANARVQYEAAIANAKKQNLASVAADIQAELNTLPQ